MFIDILGIKELLGPVSNQEFFSYHIKDIKSALIGDDKAEGTGLIIQEDLEQLSKENKQIKGEYTGLGKGKNLIVIQVEALQNFVIDLVYEGQEITPNLNRLIRESGSFYFDNYYQHIGRGNTSDAEFVTNNSLYPAYDYPTYEEYADNTFYGLPWILRDNKYTAWVFHGYKKEFWNREKAYVNLGFERFISEEDYEFTEKESIGFGIIDEVFFSQTLDYIKELDNVDENPFYAFIITLTSHTPFNMPGHLQTIKLREEHINTMLGNYLQAIHYADKALGEFLEGLRREGYYDNSVVAIYGDHFAIFGSEQRDRDIMSDLLNKPYNLGDIMNVPLIIHIPGLEDNKTISKIGSQLDFLPTILNIMGYENQKGIMFGKDLLNYEGDNFVAPLVYAVKGSFITDDVIFYMSRDGIFKNSYAIDRKTNEKIEDIESLRPIYEKVIEDINKSHYILKHDLLKQLIESGGKADIDGLEISNLPLEDSIPKCVDNPIYQLKENTVAGKRVISVEVKWDSNKEKVLLKDGTNIDKLIQFMKDNKDVYIVLRTSEEDESIFLKIKDDYKEVIDRLIVEMKNFESLAELTGRAYRYVMLNLNSNQYSEEDVVEFLKRSPLAAVIVDGNSYSKSLVEKVKGMNIPVYLDYSYEMKVVQ
ncbi:MAG: sulfatase-like hydrolase/transferase [Tissierellia bacterium]|nr:sulfatase-like hydrolase/transferase [Tissierellia bacterium]